MWWATMQPSCPVRELVNGTGLSGYFAAWRHQTPSVIAAPWAHSKQLEGWMVKGWEWFGSPVDQWKRCNTISLIFRITHGSRWQMAFELFSEMALSKLADEISLTALIGTCAKASQWSQALNALRKAHANNFKSDSILYNATMNACQNAAEWQKVLDLYEEMTTKHLRPTSATHSILISSFEKSAQWERALWQFSQVGLLQGTSKMSGWQVIRM